MAWIVRGKTRIWTGEHPEPVDENGHTEFQVKALETLGVQATPGIESRNGHEPTFIETQLGISRNEHGLIGTSLRKTIQTFYDAPHTERTSRIPKRAEYPQEIQSHLEAVIRGRCR